MRSARARAFSRPPHARKLVGRVVARRRPRRVLVCVIYYLDETSGGRSADGFIG